MLNAKWIRIRNTHDVGLERSKMSESGTEMKGENSRSCDIEKDLIPFKSFFLFFYGAIGSVFPYWSLYYKQLGFTPNQIGLISGIRPIIGFCNAPLWNSLADRFGVSKILLMIATVGWLALVTTIGFVPPASVTEENCPFQIRQTNISTGDEGYQTTSPLVSTTIHRNKSDRVRRAETNTPTYPLDGHLTHILEELTNEDKLLEERGWMFDPVELYHLFSTILILVVLGELLMSPASALADSSCIQKLGNENIYKYGYQRVWGSIGLCLMVLLVGGVISTTRKQWTVCELKVIFTDYRIAFLFFAGNMVSCFVSTIFFTFGEQKQESNGSRPTTVQTMKIFLTAHNGSWLVCLFFMGLCNGVISGFLNWHLENIGATQLVIGTLSCVASISDIVMFFNIFFLIRWIGHVNLMLIGLFGYVIRFCAYAAITDPWLILPFEILQGFNFAAVWVVMTSYLCMSIPNEYIAKVQRIIHAVYWGLGSGFGHMLAGVLVQHLGAPNTFWSFAAASAVNLGIFALIHKVSERPVEIDDYEMFHE